MKSKKKNVNSTRFSVLSFIWKSIIGIAACIGTLWRRWPFFMSGLALFLFLFLSIAYNALFLQKAIILYNFDTQPKAKEGRAHSASSVLASHANDGFGKLQLDEKENSFFIPKQIMLKTNLKKDIKIETAPAINEKTNEEIEPDAPVINHEKKDSIAALILDKISSISTGFAPSSDAIAPISSPIQEAEENVPLPHKKPPTFKAEEARKAEEAQQSESIAEENKEDAYKADIKRAQKALRLFGDRKVPLSGIYDTQTIASIKAFQRLFSLQPTGRADEKLFAKMREIGLSVD